jgi:hypothetical protein
MSATTAPHHPRLAAQLPPPEAYHYFAHTLRQLPPPTNNPEDRALRDQVAIDHFASLRPANAAEAKLAALHLAASQESMECLRLAQQHETTPLWAAKCRAQANALARQSQAFLNKLLRMQAVRQKREANSEARQGAG